MILYGTLFVLCASLIGVAHWYELKNQREEAFARSGTIASGLADQISAKHVESLLAKYDGRGMLIKNTQDAWYYVMHDHLRKAVERNASKLPIQVLAYDSLKRELQLVCTSEDRPDFRSAFKSDPQPILSAYKTGGNVTTAGDILVAFKPLVTEDGRTAGIILVSAPGSDATASAYAALIRNIIMALVLFAIAGFVLFRYVGRWVRQTEADRFALVSRNLDITDSISYAGKIQRALVPPPSAYAALFTESFIIDRPKDLVSGDFHWCHPIGQDECFVAAADCTGHGLPGAMMAAIGCSLLNEIVPANADKDPAELLTMINTRLVATLHQQGRKKGGGDGMDIALCRIDRHQREILFAGAFRPLYWLHQGQLTVINGDRKPIGGAHHDLERKFTCHRLAYQPGDRIYLFSDGYVDQFGGPERERFMTARLTDLLNSIHHLPLERQATLLDEAFLSWKGSEDQVDDVCLLGLAV
ncbi:MAG: serine/threonine-protein phosphatase [Flavobacteriales bacterium]|nr:serine/threonine-protein phosphatase [Flavobacteriales bacterium]MCC6936953.1 serine/threonine-protein phosphatase [Flavobacteriales bacterium]